MSDAVFEFRKPLRDITIPDHDSVATLSISHPCEVQNCGKMTKEHWELLMNNNHKGDVYLCEGHGNTNKRLQVSLDKKGKIVIRDK